MEMFHKAEADMDAAWKRRHGRVGEVLAQILGRFSLDIVSIVAQYAYELRFRETRPWKGGRLLDHNRVVCIRDGEFVVFTTENRVSGRFGSESFIVIRYCDAQGSRKYDASPWPNLGVCDVIADHDKQLIHLLLAVKELYDPQCYLYTIPFPSLRTHQSGLVRISDWNLTPLKIKKARSMCQLGDSLYVFRDGGCHVAHTDGTLVKALNQKLGSAFPVFLHSAALDARTVVSIYKGRDGATYVDSVDSHNGYQHHWYWQESSLCSAAVVSPNGQILIAFNHFLGANSSFHFADLPGREHLGRWYLDTSLLPHLCVNPQESLLYVWTSDSQWMRVYEF